MGKLKYQHKLGGIIMKVNKVAILGGGNGGITAAADLSNRGFEVSLFQSEKFCKNLDVIKEKGEIILQTLDSESVEKVNLVTDDIEKAILGAQIIMLAIPGMAVEYFAEILAMMLVLRILQMLQRLN